MTKKFRRTVVCGFALCCAVLLAVALLLNIKTANDSRELLEESIRSQLLSITKAAREMIDVEHLDSWNSTEDAENDPVYEQTLMELRSFADSTGASYIYVLKEYDGEYYFVMDTDEEDPEIFIVYEAEEVHQRAFHGTEVAGVVNVVDEYGSFNTGAVPIYKDGKVIAVVSADIEDRLYTENLESANRNTVLMGLTLLLVIAIISLLLINLLRRIQAMTDRLERLARYDKLTQLPNREYLISHLTEATTGKKAGAPFTLIFIDVDNFKTVNDSAGHDAGDELLEGIAQYLQNAHKGSTAFRPTAGKLNVAARIGGDEFLLVVDGLEDEQSISDFCQELVDNFKPQINNRHIEMYNVGISVGASRYPHDSRDHNVLIKYADIAMYHAKKNGKNNFKIYAEDMAPKDEK